MIGIAILTASIVIPAFLADDILYAIAGFAAAIIITMLMNPMPTLSESVIVAATLIVGYAGAVYLTKRAVVYLSKIRFGNH